MMYYHSFKICLLFIIVAITLTPMDSINWQETPMIWTEDVNSTDPFYDKVVSISIDLTTITTRRDTKDSENHTLIATGVMISNNQVLTSFNAFRNLTRNKNFRKSIVVGVLRERIYENENITQNLDYALIVCGRQVIPLRDQDLTRDDWHGNDHLHSPIHDIMVLRTAYDLSMQDKNSDLNVKKGGGNRWTKLSGPQTTVVAEKDQFIGREIKIASIGHENDKQIFSNLYLLPHEYEPEENVIANCDQWLPRQWGHFICVRNVNDFKAIASGAALFYNDTLFGIGSFALKKGRNSILVFTDVRPYFGLINETCTPDDQTPSKDDDKDDDKP